MMKSLVIAVVAAAFLAGCANTPRKAFNREGAAQLKSVAVAERVDEESYNINIIAHPGVNFGLIGGLIAAADLTSKSNKLTAALDPAQTALQKRLSTKVAEQLNGTGYETSITYVPARTDSGKAYEVLRANLATDAVLDLGIYGGYTAAGPGSDYLPYIRVDVITKDVKSGETLYQDVITYGYTHQGQQTVHLESDARYRFKDLDDLMSRKDLAREGLQAGIDLVATQVAADLKR